ncbi:hypothetical protein EMOOHJMP_00159 [Microcystis phage MaAM05]|nr:hypothetical protein EMOOHJMP_00159 [Microcystis phage MaAM05]
MFLQSGQIRESQDLHGPERPTNPQDGNASPSFSIFRALKETVKGVCAPIVTMVKHPVKTAVALAGTVALTSVAPITIPIMVVTGLATGGWQVLKGVKSAVSEAKQGNYTASEKAFGHIGEGGFGLISSLLGVRQAGSVAAESKAARLSFSSTASATEKLRAVDQGLEAAVKVRNGTWQNALNQTLSVFSPEGLKTTGVQLNPKRLTQLLTGKLQHWRAQFHDSPVVPLDEPLAKAQRFLKLKDPEMPEIQNHLVKPDGRDVSGRVHGFYDPQNHRLQVESDRLKAFRGRLIPPLRHWLDKLPQPVQTFIGNRYNQTIPVQEVVTHELTHAWQFNQVASLTREQALQTLTQKFPGVSAESIEAICNGLRFHGNGSPAMKQAGQRVLTQVAEFELTQNNLRDIQLEGLGKMNAVNRLKSQILSLKTYIRAGFEVEARQKAAEAGIAQIAKQMTQSRGLFEESQLLQHYKTLKLEGKLNKLLGRLNSTSAKLTPERSGQTRQHLQQWLNLPKLGSLTQNYLLQEQKLLRTTEQLNRFIQWTETLQKAKPTGAQVSQAQWSLKAFSNQVAHWAKGLLNRIKRFFTPAGLQRFEQKHHNLKGSYVQSVRTLTQSSTPAESAA